MRNICMVSALDIDPNISGEKVAVLVLIFSLHLLSSEVHLMVLSSTLMSLLLPVHFALTALKKKTFSTIFYSLYYTSICSKLMSLLLCILWLSYKSLAKYT